MFSTEWPSGTSQSKHLKIPKQREQIRKYTTDKDIADKYIPASLNIA